MPHVIMLYATTWTPATPASGGVQVLGPGHRRRATPEPILRFPSPRPNLCGPLVPCLIPATELLFSFLWLRPLLVLEQGIAFLFSFMGWGMLSVNAVAYLVLTLYAYVGVS